MNLTDVSRKYLGYVLLFKFDFFTQKHHFFNGYAQSYEAPYVAYLKKKDAICKNQIDAKNENRPQTRTHVHNQTRTHPINSLQTEEEVRRINR